VRGAGRWWHQAQVLEPDVRRRRGRRLPHAADHPAHPSFPWQDEALAVATHKPLVHIDLSGWSPKYFPPNLVRYANTLLQDKVLFGSDFPMITPDRWLRDFETLEIKPDVRAKILKGNAVRLLGLG
jgi:predicted TIM-barrel fold metal-dependent hydrolase